MDVMILTSWSVQDWCSISPMVHFWLPFIVFWLPWWDTSGNHRQNERCSVCGRRPSVCKISAKAVWQF